MTKGKEKSNFRVESVSPRDLSPEVFVDEFDKALAALKKLEKAQRGKREIEVKVNHNGPIEVIMAGDLHLGSFATDMEMVEDLRDYLLETENAVLILMGDEIEGFKARYATTNVAGSMPNLQNQLDYFYFKFFKPLADAGKITGVVSGYWGHPGWMHDDTTANPWAIMTRHHPDIPLIANGGVMKFRFKNGRGSDLMIFHNPPGNSKVDPIHGIRDRAQNMNPANRPNIYGAAHKHQAMTSKEHPANADDPIVLIQTGTPKGSNPDLEANTDAFGEKAAMVPHTAPWTQGVVLQPPYGRKGYSNSKPKVEYPFISKDQGSQVFGALTLLEEATRLNVLDEVLEEILDQYPEPDVVYSPGRSKVSDRPADLQTLHNSQLRSINVEDNVTQGDLRPLYKTVSYRVKTPLPIQVHAFSNARFGSIHELSPNLPVERYTEIISQNPYAFAIYLRNMMDEKVPGKKRRMDALDRYIAMVELMENRALGVLLDGSLGHTSWLKRLGDDHHLRPVAAGSLLSSRTDTKLLHSMSYVNLSVGPNPNYRDNIRYPIQVVDKLFMYGSNTAPKGIKRVYDLMSEDRPAILMGGHTPVSAVGQLYDSSNLYTPNPVLVSPGTWAKFIGTKQIGQRHKGGEPGQAVILVPGVDQSEAMMIPTSNIEETQMLMDAMTLYVGSELIGVRDQLMSGSK